MSNLDTWKCSRRPRSKWCNEDAPFVVYKGWTVTKLAKVLDGVCLDHAKKVLKSDFSALIKDRRYCLGFDDCSSSRKLSFLDNFPFSDI